MTTENETTPTTLNDLPAGTWHTMRAESWEWFQAGTGTLGLRITYVVTEDGPYRGLKPSGKLWFSEKTIEKTSEKLRLLGFEGETTDEIGAPNVGGLDANEVRGVIKHELSQDGTRTYVEVDNIVPQKKREAAPVDAGALRRASDLLRGALRKHDKANGTQPARTAQSGQGAQGGQPVRNGQSGASVPRPQATTRTAAPQRPPQPDYGPSAGDDEIPFDRAHGAFG